MKKELKSAKLLGAIGVEAIVALKKVDIEPDYLYGVVQAAIEAARSGLNFTIICTSNESPALLQRLNEENLSYTAIDLKIGKSKSKRK
jgi:putative transcriptional regulator